MDEIKDDLAAVLLPFMRLRTISGESCTVTRSDTWDGLFGDEDTECYIDAQVGSMHEEMTTCFPAGAQLLTEDGNVLSIEQVHLGSPVQIIGASGKSSYAPVHTISHADADRAVAFCFAETAGPKLTAECSNVHASAGLDPTNLWVIALPCSPLRHLLTH